MSLLLPSFPQTEYASLPDRGTSARSIKRELLRIASYFHTADQVTKLFEASRGRAKDAKQFILSEHRIHDVDMLAALQHSAGGGGGGSHQHLLQQV